MLLYNPNQRLRFYLFIHIFRVNLVCLDTQGTLVSKVLWEKLVCLDYRGPLEQKDNQAFLDFLVILLFLNASFSPSLFTLIYVIKQRLSWQTSVLFPNQTLTSNAISDSLFYFSIFAQISFHRKWKWALPIQQHNILWAERLVEHFWV